MFEELKKTAAVKLTLNNRGFEIELPKANEVSADVAVQCLVTTQYQNIRKLDPNLHCKLDFFQLEANMIFYLVVHYLIN